jgi:hypothetical protein
MPTLQRLAYGKPCPARLLLANGGQKRLQSWGGVVAFYRGVGVFGWRRTIALSVTAPAAVGPFRQSAHEDNSNPTAASVSGSFQGSQRG